MVIEITRTTGADPRSLALRTEMDAETFGLYAASFAAMEPEVRARLDAALHTDQAELVEVVIASEGGVDLGHAALRALAGGGYEVKKVFVRSNVRGRGLSRILMSAIEDVARDKGEQRIVLQTGPKQLEAISLYEKTGYEPIAAFGPYVGLDDMVYFAKAL
jgi:GNAT superfamily N-acetyltransferase